jgi:hypothetical protein
MKYSQTVFQESPSLSEICLTGTSQAIIQRNDIEGNGQYGVCFCDESITSVDIIRIDAMRATIKIDDDVLEHARALAAKLREPFKDEMKNNPR